VNLLTLFLLLANIFLVESYPLLKRGFMFGMVERSRFEDFISAPSNILAKDAAFKTASKPLYWYNPLVITGGSGCGKTHLLWAINNFLGKSNLSDKVWLEDFPVRAQLDCLVRLLNGDCYNERDFDWYKFFLFDAVESLADYIDAWAFFIDLQRVLVQSGKQVVWCWTTTSQPFGDRFCNASRFGNELAKEVKIDPFQAVCRKKVIRALSVAWELNLPEESIETLSMTAGENFLSVVEQLVK